LESFNEDDLYANLDWLDEHQQHIEDRLFAIPARDSVQRFWEKAQVAMPEALPRRGVQVATRKKLQARRKTR